MHVDGAPAIIGQKVDPTSTRITIDGIPLPVRPDGAYYLLYKPVGVISTVSDERGRPAVVDLVPSQPPVYPVGRLDADSEGLLILTNDGDLTHRLTHPSFRVTKTYTVLTSGSLSARQVRRLERGVELDDGVAAAESARIIDSGKRGTLLEVVMTEGRNREVRRMVAALGEEVQRLVRTAIAELTDSSLQAGEWRHLEPSEVRRLYVAAGRVAPGACENGPGRAPEDGET